MTKNWDSGNDSNYTSPNMLCNQRAIEFYTTGSTNIWLWIDNNQYLWYSHGTDATWTDTQLTGTGGTIHSGLSSCINASIAIDHNNDHVHICYTGGTHVYHAQCTVPLTPGTATNWTDYGGSTYYQQVDNDTQTKYDCAIAVDGDTGNGNDDPHIVWSQNNAGTDEVHYNYGSGANHAFTTGSEIAIESGANGAVSPTIVAVEEDGRELYIFWLENTTKDIECSYCPDASAPLTLANWGGPVAGAGNGPDTVLSPGIGDTAMSAPSATYWWDTDARVGVTSVATPTTDDIHFRIWDSSTPAWTTERTVTNMTGTPTESMLTNIDNANEWRIVYMVTDGTMYHGYKAGDDFTSGVTWYKLATTTGVAGYFFSCEWRDRSDVVTAEDRSTCVWVDSSNNLWYSHIRPNATPTVTLVHPINLEYEDELGSIQFTWDITDTDGDQHHAYYCEIDDDNGFGSPVADPGAPTGDLVLNAWTVTGTMSWGLEASTLAANTTYYWRVKVRDSEFGTEYDPNSESSFPTYEDFKTTPQVVIDVTGTTQKADGGCEIQFKLTMPAGWPTTKTVELYHAGDTNEGAEYYDSSWHECSPNASWHSAGVPDTISVDAGDTICTYGWDAITDLATDYDGNVNVRISVRFQSDENSLGVATDTLNTQPLDFADPTSVALGTPVGGTTTKVRPTINFSASDTTGWEAKLEVHRNSGYTDLLTDSLGYLGSGVTSWQLNVNLEYAGTWYVRIMTRDTTATQNENSSWTTGNFNYVPPPAPTECFFGSWSIEVDPTKAWTGSEFDVVDDVVGNAKYREQTNAPHTLSFTLQNINGKFTLSSSDYFIKMGDEVKQTREYANFYGIVKTLKKTTSTARTLEVYCESFIGAADAFPIQARIVPTSQSGLYWEDYISIALASAGTKPRWFLLVDMDGNPYYLENSDKTPVLGDSDIVYDKVSHVEFLNDIVSRTGRTWWEGLSTPTGRKAYIYFGSPSDPSTGTTDSIFYLESDVLAASLKENQDSIINRVIFTDADVMEQDMNSIRTYGVHTKVMASEGVGDATRLAEIAQYIIEERKTPRASGSVPIFGEPDININDLVRIYEEDADDLASGFSGNYLVVGVERTLGMSSTVSLQLTSRWENPIIKQLQQLLSDAKTSDEEIVILRGETAEARLECPTDNVTVLSTTSNVGRIGVDRVSDEDTDSNYYTKYGGPS